jgi:hypothetical protein
MAEGKDTMIKDTEKMEQQRRKNGGRRRDDIGN